jgi:hypothetical protein
VFKVLGAGWRQFCHAHDFDPELCWSCLPGYGTIRDAKQMAETAAFKPDEAVSYLARSGHPACGVQTAELIADELEQLLQLRTAWWDGER